MIKKTIKKLGIEENVLNLTKSTYRKKLIANIVFIGEIMKTSLRSGWDNDTQYQHTQSIV